MIRLETVKEPTDHGVGTFPPPCDCYDSDDFNAMLSLSSIGGMNPRVGLDDSPCGYFKVILLFMAQPCRG